MAEFEFERDRRPAALRRDQHPANVAQPGSSVASGDIAAGPARLLQQAKEAIAEFEEMESPAIQIRQDPAVTALMAHAQVLIKAREHRLAVNLLRNVLMRSPENPQALLRMGVCLRETGRYDESLKCFRALAKITKGIMPQILIAETLYLGERDEMALAAYREVLKNVIEDESQLFDIYKNVGNIHVRAGDFESAEEFYDKAYTLRQDSDVLMVNYGTLEIQRENLGEAVERFRKAVDLNENNDKAWVGLAIVHMQMGDFELAWANIERALDVNKANRTAIRLSVEWAVQEGRFGSCIQRLQDYLSTEGEDAEMSFTLAKIFTHVGRLREARLEMERVLALDPAMEGAEALMRALCRSEQA
jgi:tetratricopeptide (TPR) repeat protein